MVGSDRVPGLGRSSDVAACARACEAGASPRENAHQMRRARKRRKDFGVSLEAGLSGVQVGEREHLSAHDCDEPIAADAVEFCSVLAGRGEATGLLRTIVPF